MMSLQAALLLAEFVGNECKEVESYGENELTMNLKDVNRKYYVPDDPDAGVAEYLRHIIDDEYELEFGYGNGNWVTVKFNKVN